MAASPVWKVYAGAEYVASCKYAEDAGALVAFRGDGASIRYRHTMIVWQEGKEAQGAAESYDHVAVICHQRAGLRA